ncbi:ABC transporter permease [Ferrimonas pelagia]|uniref:ABC transporter permease n=1 Tax=Ferrimonas pelagia TaxID=1177826 RepID=A0ABP9EM87_9GAMM
MFSYYLRLAWLSLKQTPVISALMVLAMAIGIGAAGTSLTVHYTMSHNPMAHKNDQLYAVQLKAHHDDYDGGTSDELDLQLTYPDADNINRMSTPQRSTAMIRAGFSIKPDDPQLHPFMATGRATGRDFFGMFEVPFLYGAPWSTAVDTLAEPVTVISRALNDKLFGGENSVGQTIEASNHLYTVVGVIDDFHPQPLFYDLNNGAFHEPEEMFVPFSLLPVNKIEAFGNRNGWKSENLQSYDDWLRSEMYWVQYWVELETPAQKADFEQELAGYIKQQRQLGRMPSDTAFASLKNVQQWLDYNGVVSEDNRILLALSFLFLLVCMVNMIGLLLAKFLRRAAHTGVRRALGASQRQIFAQHLVEVSLIGVLGGGLGSVFALVGLAGLRQLYPYYDQLARMDITMLITVLLLSLLAAIIAGLLPAWRVGRTHPAHYLKSQ